MEHLDRDALLVPVRCGVDRRHPADTEHAIEAVLSPKHAAETRVGDRLRFVVRHRSEAEHTARETAPWLRRFWAARSMIAPITLPHDLVGRVTDRAGKQPRACETGSSIPSECGCGHMARYLLRCRCVTYIPSGERTS
jgi:hypothetical protein